MNTEAAKNVYTVIEEFQGKHCRWFIRPGQNIKIFPDSTFYQSYLLKNTIDENAPISIAGWQSIDPESIRQMFNISVNRREAYGELKKTYEKHNLNTYINLLLYKYGFEIDRKYINKIDAGQTEPIYPMVFGIDENGTVVSVLHHGKDAYDLWHLAFSNMLEIERIENTVQSDREPQRTLKVKRKLNFV